VVVLHDHPVEGSKREEHPDQVDDVTRRAGRSAQTSTSDVTCNSLVACPAVVTSPAAAVSTAPAAAVVTSPAAESATDEATTLAATSSTSLAFTGADVGGTIGVGVALVAGGVVMVRLGRRKRSA
jgi:hypothetical protein